MKDIFDENINSSGLKDSKLYKSYLEVLNTGNDNYEDFKKGCNESFNDIMQLLEERYEKIKYASGFIGLKKLIRKY